MKLSEIEASASLDNCWTSRTFDKGRNPTLRTSHRIGIIAAPRLDRTWATH